ncbi:acyl-CoA synthetase [Blastomonas sp. AAP53]|uniref:acyl-CoA synthetase n=1 Tax=Blastomonas sp. AAP53 TaxID=1248760 RepID=UPI0002F6F23B|nr:acyl-CoA synthetase [Blastomonas sp. AAP53]
MTRTRAGNWNFGDLLDIAAAHVPAERPALVRGDRTICWGDFDARTNRLARAMLAGGLQTGDRVAILARNIPEFIEIACAAFKARLTHVNINYRYTTAEIEYVLADCQAAALFHQDEFASVVAPLPAALDHLRLMVQIGGEGDGYEAMVAEGDGAPLGIVRSADDGYLLYTGGTTGRPKGVMWAAGDARAVQLESPTVRTPVLTLDDHGRQVAANVTPGRVLPACPLMHGAGLNSSMAELLMGGTAVLLEKDSFNAAELWDQVERHRVSRILIVGDVFARPMLQALEAHPGRWDLASLKVISSAGLMWSEEVKRGLVAQLPQLSLVDILGASEASGFGYAVTNALRSTPTGYFEPGRQTVIIDVETDRVLADDEPGTGWLARRPPFALGYYGDPEKTAQTYRQIDDTVYAIPGDMAERTADGLIRLIGRGNLCINTGGEKVFVEEVEEALKRAPGIEDAIVVGVPDETWGKAIVALIRTAPGYDEASARAVLEADLARYKLPRRMIVLDDLPRHASGKSDYRRATEMALAATS